MIGVAALVRSGQQQLNPTIHWGPGLGDDIARTPPASFFSPAYTLPAQAIVYRDGDVDRMDPAVADRRGAVQVRRRRRSLFLGHPVERRRQPRRANRPAPQHVPLQSDLHHHRQIAYSVRFASPQESARFFYGPKVFEELRRSIRS